MKHKVIYKGKQEFILLYNCPEPPPIMESVYADELAMRNFNNKMKFIEKHALKITNPYIMMGQFELVVDEPVDLPDGFKIVVQGDSCSVEKIKVGT